VVGKRCPAPRNGGSSRNAIFYVLAEELTSKVTHERVNEPIQEGQRAELSALMTEALERSDRGVGVVWSPAAAADGRPSSIYARGVMSLYTADVEIQSLFDAQSRVKSPVAHFVFSLNTAESATVSDEQLIHASMATLDGAGWSGHAAVATVHQDTMRYVDGKLVDGNKHCHVAIASINSRTLRAFERTQEYMRLHRSLREQEIAFGMEEDWGLYKVADRGLPSERVVRTNAVDWEARKQEQSMERAERLARHFVSDHSLESVRDREDRIVHALRDYLDRCADRGEKPLQSDIHAIAARLTAVIEGVIDGKLTVRLMERAEKGSVRSAWTDSFGIAHERMARWTPTDTLIPLDEKRIARSPLDAYSGKTLPTPLLQQLHSQALERRKFLQSVGTQEAAEAEYRRVIREDPGRVTRDIVHGQGQANFTADDVDTLLATHITEGWSDETDRVLREDKTVRVLSADTQSPLYTIETQRDISAKFDTLLRELLTEKDPLFDRAALDEAIRRVETRRRAENPEFAFTAQQLKALDSLENRVAVWAGDAGTGKTVLNEVHREMAEISGREIRGVATAQKAADELARSSGIKSVNQARALVEEARDGVAVMPQDARYVFDEFSMASIESGVAILERARAANASGVLQGDLAQLPNIAAGNTFGIATRAAADNKALVRLSEVFRQSADTQVAFMREAVPRAGKAIRSANRAAFAAYVETFMDRGLVTHHESREQEVAAIAADIVEAMRAGQRVIAPGRSFQDCLYVNRAVRAELGMTGTGREFEFDRGVIELSAGDRVLFRANNRRLDVRNGDTGTVSAIAQDADGRWQITVALDNGKTATFDPNRYHKLEYGYASTIHANQGTGALVVIGSITKSDDARSAHVTFTRAEQILHIHTQLTREDILKQLASDRSLAAKDDALMFASIVNRTGGPDTKWAKAVARAQAFDDDPLRKRYEAVMARRAGDFRKTIIDILDGQRGIKPRERDRQLRSAAARYAPESFITWAAKERATLEHEWDTQERAARVRPERDLKRAQERNLEIKAAMRRAIGIQEPEPPKKSRGRRH
jgi:ATP-dependent exoDNAse (exonuclease V) alpha subunit